VKCGDSYHLLEGSTAVGGGGPYAFYEFKGPLRITTTADTLSEIDIANEIEWRGTTSAECKMERVWWVLMTLIIPRSGETGTPVRPLHS
jgi:hypothetical protein